MTHLYAKATEPNADATVRIPNNRAAAPAEVNLEPAKFGTDKDMQDDSIAQ